MKGEKSKQIKVYFIIGLALVAAIVGYFRFIHKRAAHDVERTLPTVPVAQFNVPDLKVKIPQNDKLSEPPANEFLRVDLRDVFAPLKSPIKAKRQPSKQEPAKTESQPTKQGPSRPLPSLKLRGTIVGGERPIAIINDQFVRTGDWIGEYRVVSIGKTWVLLDSGNRIIELEMVKKNE